MKQREIIELIEFSPSHLKLYFENIIVVDNSLPHFGNILNGKDTMLRCCGNPSLSIENDVSQMIEIN